MRSKLYQLTHDATTNYIWLRPDDRKSANRVIRCRRVRGCPSTPVGLRAGGVRRVALAGSRRPGRQGCRRFEPPYRPAALRRPVISMVMITDEEVDGLKFVEPANEATMV